MAANSVLPLFRSPFADWGFLNAEDGYDPRFNHLIDAFVFEESAIKDREATFAAAELFGTYREHTLAAAQRPSDFFEITVKLPPLVYDMQAKALRLKKSGTNKEKQVISFLPPAKSGLYETQSDTVFYETGAAGTQLPQEYSPNKRSTNPGISYDCSGANSPAAYWR